MNDIIAVLFLMLCLSMLIPLANKAIDTEFQNQDALIERHKQEIYISPRPNDY